MSHWSKNYFADLAERVASTAIYGVVTMLTADASGAVSGSAQQWWVVVGLPTALSLLKGILGNLANPASGASVLPTPPGPDVPPDEPEDDDPTDDPRPLTDPLAPSHTNPYHDAHKQV